MKHIQFISVDTLVHAIYSRTFIEAIIFSLLLLLIRTMLPLILLSLMLPYPFCEANIFPWMHAYIHLLLPHLFIDLHSVF